MPLEGQTLTHKAVSRKPWWCEAEALCLIVLVVVAYFTRAHLLPLRGEEPTRAQIAREMVDRGDWVVPRQQGEPFLIRPPVQNWAIALSCLAVNSWEPWAIRLHAVVATLLTTLMMYGYSRSFLSRLGSLAAGASFATLADMFQMGRQAETEALFIFFLSSSLLLWHLGMVRGWPGARTWAIGYGLMVLAMLTKGLQAPAYFIASVGLYLLITRQWTRLFSKGHLVGLLVGIAILLAWNIPYANAVGWSDASKVWLGDAAISNNGAIGNWSLGTFALHLVRYPLEIAAGTLPWSGLLLLFLLRDFRRLVKCARPQIMFACICLSVAFPTCWIPPGGQARFFAPLYPCLSVLVGLVAQCATSAEAGLTVRRAWERYALVVCGLMTAGATAVLVLALIGPYIETLRPITEAPPVALGCALASCGLATLLLRVRRSTSPAQVKIGILALSIFMIICFTGVGTDIRSRKSENVAEAIARVKAKLPPRQQLVSIDGHAHSLFAYYYGTPTIIPGTGQYGPGAEVQPDYFCLSCSGKDRPELGFRWEEIGVVSLDRNHRTVPNRVVVVGHRLPDPAQH